MSYFSIQSEGHVSLVPGFLEKSSKYQRTWLCIDTKMAWEPLYYAKQKVENGLLSNGILVIQCHKVNMGNIYSSDSTCSDKPLNIRERKV